MSLFVLALVPLLLAQTYQVGPGSTETPRASTDQTPSASKTLGWGSNIQNARLARAAELALKDGDNTRAVDYAQRAAQATPNDAQLWFLLGYAARLDGKSQLSADAYSRGLRLNTSYLDGLSGVSQTYSTMGRTAEGERLLKRVL